jgi:hypothetical protein
MSVIRKTFRSTDGKSRVEIFQRDDQTFGFAEFRFSTEENAWLQVGRYSVAIIDTLGNAIREANERVQWLSVETTFSNHTTS